MCCICVLHPQQLDFVITLFSLLLSNGDGGGLGVGGTKQVFQSVSAAGSGEISQSVGILGVERCAQK